jgi:hypothetical protein
VNVRRSLCGIARTPLFLFRNTAALVKALGRLCIQDWEVVGDAEGEPLLDL